MKNKILGAMTGVLVAAGLILAFPATAQALSWSLYANGNYAYNAKPTSSSGQVKYDLIFLDPPSGSGAQFWLEKATIQVNTRKGAILAQSTSTVSHNYQISVSVPQTNTVGTCKLVPLSGAYLGGNSFHKCSAYK